MATVPQRTPGIRELDWKHYLQHYWSLLWRWKLWVVITTPIAGIIAIVIVLKLSNTIPELPATALIGMEPMTGMIDIIMTESPTDESTHEKLIKSRIFLQNIVNILSLRLRLKHFGRSEIFDTVSMRPEALSGRYDFVIDKDTRSKFSVFFKGRLLEFRRDIIARGNLATLETLSYPGVWLKFKESFLKEPHNFSFSIVPNRVAVEALFSKLTVTSPSTRMQRNPSFSISVEGTDYQLIATISNTIAEKYVEKNLELRSARSSSALAILEKQLLKAKSELNDAEQSLKNFRTVNPTVGLTQNTNDILTAMTESERANLMVETTLNNATTLRKKVLAASKENRIDAAREALVFLNANGSSSAPVLESELTRLLAERRELLRAYDSNHPTAVQNQQSIDDILLKVTAELFSTIKNLEAQNSSRSSRITVLSDKIRTLPAKELQLAQLTRQQQVNSDIFSKILDKYNQAKVSDVVEMSDIYVMDYAVPPIPPPANLPKMLGICLLICVLIIFGPMILVDMTSKVVRTESELRAILPFSVLESIPTIVPKFRQADKSIDIIPQDRKIKDPGDRLITNEFKQEYVKELFRSLRTKILLSCQKSADKSLIITSLEAHAGKSTIASNLAIAMAQHDLKTILIDGDLRMGMLSRFFDNTRQSPGLSDFLGSSEQLTREAVAPLIQPTPIPGLSIIASGRKSENAAELISSSRFRECRNLLSKMYDFIIFDSPPIGPAADALTVIDDFSYYLFVVRAGKTNTVDLKKKIEEYPQVKTKLLGLVLNFASIDSRLRYYKYSKYYKHPSHSDI